jgi:hypothetical protein
LLHRFAVSQIDSIILQFKELGLMQFAEKKEQDGRKFRGVTLTELGERHLSLLNMRRAHPQPDRPKPKKSKSIDEKR